MCMRKLYRIIKVNRTKLMKKQFVIMFNFVNSNCLIVLRAIAFFCIQIIIELEEFSRTFEFRKIKFIIFYSIKLNKSNNLIL